MWRGLKRERVIEGEMRDEQGTTIDDGRRIGLEDLSIIRSRIWISEKPPFHNIGVITDSWDYYPNRLQAERAYQEWNPMETPEPNLWSRHLHSGRYRILGQPNLEYCRCDGKGDLTERLKKAVEVSVGEERIIHDIKEESERLGVSFPYGTEYFMVISYKPSCPHTPKCLYYESVYHYLGRFVVVHPWLLERKVTVGNVIRRLTDQT